MSWALTGFSVNRQAQPTAGYRLDVLGAVRTESEVAGDATLFLTMVGFGANSATTSLMTGNRDPNGLVSALPGTLYLRSDGVNSNLYENVSVGPGVGTSWATVASLAAVPTWAAVLGAGNTSGGTDAVMSNTDELRWEDGATVTRRSDDLNGGEPRTRYFTAAAALAAMLSIATATGVMSYTDDFTLASPNATETIGDGAGSPGLNAVKAEAGEFSFGVFSAGFPRWSPAYVPSDETLRSARYDAAGVFINYPWVLQNPTLQTTLNDTLISLAAANVLEDLGDDTGSPSRRSRKSDGGQTLDRWYSNGIERFLSRLDVAETQSFEHYTAAAALDAIVSFTTNTITYGAVDALVTMLAPSGVSSIGDDTGLPIRRFRKGGAGQAEIEWYSAGVLVWQDGVDASENRWIARTGVNFAILLPIGSETTELRDTLIHATRPDVVVQAGDNTGTQPQIQLRAAAASSNYFSHYQNNVRMWDTGQTHNDVNWYVDRFVGGAFTDSTFIDNAGGHFHLPNNLYMNDPSAYHEMGNGTGSVSRSMLKVDAGDAGDNWYNTGAFTLTWRGWYFAPDESLNVERTGFNTPIRLDPGGTFITRLQDGTIWLPTASVIFQVGDATGSPDELKYKADAGEYDQQWFNVLALRWVARHRTDEQFEKQRRDAAGAFVNNAYLFNAAATAATTATTLGDASTVWGYIDPYLQIGGTTTALWTVDYIKDDAGSGSWNLYNEAVRRFYCALTTAENTQFVSFSAAAALLTLIQFQAGVDQLLFCYTPSPVIETGDNTGGPAWLTNKAEASTTTRDIVSAALTRFRELMNASEEVFHQKFTAAGALETEIAYLAGGFVRVQTHIGITDAIAAPAALAGYAKLYLDSAANGRPRLIEGDGSIEQLGIGVTSQAMPVADRETTDLVVANTVVETDIFSYSVPANTLGGTGELHCEVGGFIHHEGTATLRFRIYLGATTLYDSTTNVLTASADDDAAFFILVDLGNQNATNDQAGIGFVMVSNPSNATTGVGDLASGVGGQVSTPISLGDGAVDTTAAQTFRISVTWSAADANNRLVRRNAYATLAAAA